MAYQNLARHLKSCVGDGRFCAICETMLVNMADYEIRDHLHNCGKKTYPCMECGICFSTGIARKAHNCAPLPPTRKRHIIDPPGTKSAVKGLFKIIELTPKSSSWGYESVMYEEKPRIVDILRLVFIKLHF